MSTSLEKDWLSDLRAGDTTPLQSLLDLYAERCVRQLQRYCQCDTATAQDAFLDALLELRDRVADGRLTECRSPDGYLYRTARNMLLKSRQKQQRQHKQVDNVARYFYDYLDAEAAKVPPSVVIEEVEEDDRQVAKIMCAFAQLSTNCQQLLRSFYIHRRSMEDIAAELGLKNATTAKSTKSRCMQKWRQLLQEQV